MSLDFYLRIKKKIVTESILIQELNKNCETPITKPQVQEKDLITIDEKYKEMGFLVILNNCVKEPYNVLDSNFKIGEYKYEQVINFCFDKTSDLNIAYSKAFQIIFSLISLYNEEALLSSNFTDDICYFDNNLNVLLNINIPFIKDINISKLTDRTISYINIRQEYKT